MIRLIGDIHSFFEKYDKLRNCEYTTIQVGDMGIGFGNDNNFSPSYKDFFINGNHDNPDECYNYPTFLGKPNLFGKFFYFGGGFSVDYSNRTPGIDWWANEELTYEEMNKAIDLYEQYKPEFMISHEAPYSLHKLMSSRVYPPSRTSQALQQCFEIHKPKFWFYGHWHMDFRAIVDGTHFVCVNKNSYVDFDEINSKVGGTVVT